jgi:lipopolysaccharide/colanic/teichoic acid biosynthesis glycosyltransferase
MCGGFEKLVEQLMTSMSEQLARPRGYPGKRLLDVVLAGLALLLLAPVLLVLMGLVWLSVGRPIFFRQERPGFDGKPFHILKFRTMTDARDTAGGLLPDGQRLTRLGAFLRQTSLDELPELLNVLRGDMSLVGPRPLLFRYMPYFRPRERLRFEVLPGITGLAQVSGRNCVGWDQRLELDARYVESMSLEQDLRILWRTLVTVVRREGVSADVDQVETWLDEERSAALTASSVEAGHSGGKQGG